MNKATHAFLSVMVSVLAFGAAAPVALAAANPTTQPATGVTMSDATLNGTNGDTAATDEAFWYGPTSGGPFVSDANPGSQLPPGWTGVYATTQDLSPSGAFSYPLTGLSRNTAYHYVAWTLVAGTWYPGDVVDFTTEALPVYIDSNTNGTVDPGEQDFSSIQAAVDAATAGDTIEVGSGTYQEHVVVAKALTINGANSGVAGNGTRSAESIIDATGSDAAIVVSASDVTIDGFTITNGGGSLSSGIWMGNPDPSNVTIENSIFMSNMSGIWADCGGDCVIDHNLFDGNNAPGGAVAGGISADSTIGLTISNNEFKNEAAGNPILLQATGAGAHTGVEVSGNSFHDNAFSNVYVLGVSGGIFSGNTIVPDPTATGLSFDGLDSDIEITGNTITGGARGIRIEDAGYFTPGESTRFEIHGNAISGNTDYGLGLTDAPTTFIGIVDATGNWWGSASGPTASDNPGGTGDKVFVTGMARGTAERAYVDYGSFCVNATCTTPAPTPTPTPSDESSGSSGGGGGGVACSPGTAYNPSTGSCTPVGGQVLGTTAGPGEGCTPGDRFSSTTGQSCGSSTGGGSGEGFIFTKNLVRGMRDNDVAELQKYLVAHGYSIPNAVTTFFGPQTFAAVQAFQKDQDLPSTGFVGPLTRAILNKGN